MKRFLFIFILATQLLSGQTEEELFDKANELYKLEQFETALKTYNKIDSLGVISTELFYNIGNCYYKLNKVAPAIYNYEKALLIDPLNEDARNNLVFARRLTIDNIEELPKSVFQKLDEAVVKKLSYDQWAVLSVSLSILGSILFLFFYFSYQSGKKRLFFVSSMICFLLLILTISFAFKEYDYAQTHIEAIIYSEEIQIKNAPTSNSEDIFALHEGTKVIVLDSVDNWKKIKIADGKVGWILSSNLKILGLY